MTSAPSIQAPDYASRITSNRRRSYSMVTNRRANLKLASEMEEWIRDEAGMGPDWRKEVYGYVGRLRSCGSESLFRNFDQGGMVLIHALTCKHKLCQVCNAERKRRLRTLYLGFFRDRPELMEEYDFMHLTLTVPHNADGWRGKRVYNKELLSAFNLMRKEDWWKDQVYAGHYAVEFTKNENGLHIHLHALLLVHKGKRNRNLLYRDILRRWNRYTAWRGANRQAFSLDEKLGIMKSLGAGSSMRWDKAEALVQALDPTGSTMVGLESLYTLRGGKKRYCRTTDAEGLMPGIMECLKYHFEPVAFRKDNGEYDHALLAEMANVLKGQRLYGKFGAFYGEKALRLEQIEEDDPQEVRELMADAVIHPAYMAPAEPGEYRYEVYDLGRVGVQKGEDGKPRGVYPSGRPKHVLQGSWWDVLGQFVGIMMDKRKGGSVRHRIDVAAELARYLEVVDHDTGEVRYEFAYSVS